jgi:serine/threonine protein kinase
MRVGAGTELAGFRVIRPIAEGGMSVVFLAERVSSGEQAAFKVLREELANNDDFRKRFLRESRYAASLDHPHVVDVHDAGEVGGVLYIVMEYVEGTDLYELLGEGPLSPAEALPLLEQVAAALDAAHAIGLLHRDVKPGNLLIDETGPELRCVLTDFGLGKQVTRDSVALTAAGDFVGTLAYTAPEQILGRDTDAGVDIYSLGCLLYECLVGEPPFAGSDAEVMEAQIETPPPMPSKKRHDLAQALDSVIAKALAKNPADRHATCLELVEHAAVATSVELPPRLEGGATSHRGNPVGKGTMDKLKLKVTGGNAVGTEINVDDELLIGRLAGGAGGLGEDIEISRRHARISRTDEGAYAIDDLGSTNVTLVNGRQITEEELLYPGDVIEVGATTMVVQVTAFTAPAEPEPKPASATSVATPVSHPETLPEEAPEPEPVLEPERSASLPRLSLRLEVDFESGEAWIELDEQSDPVPLVNEDGRWRLAP